MTGNQERSILLVTAKSPAIHGIGTSRYVQALSALAQKVGLKVENVSNMGYLDMVEVSGPKEDYQKFFNKLIEAIDSVKT